jgi:alcohol dehydrogenase YqhD (iron-dependent ADH family)
MNDFDYLAPTRHIFGRGAEKRVGEVLSSYGLKKALLHYGGQSVVGSGLLERVRGYLTAAGIQFAELGGVKPNPRLSLVYEGIDVVKNEGCDFILAVGGGSVIDSAKAIGAGYYYDGDVWELYETFTPPERILPVASVLTIPAAGSETSDGSVITNEGKQMKLGFGAKAFRPLVSFVNPELFFTLPKSQIANGVSDMIAHVFERYFTQTTHTDLTDSLCEATIKTIMKNGPKLIGDPTDYDAWAEIGFAGSFAHVGLLGMGRAEDWATHNIEHELSAIYDIAHGAGLAILFPAWMKYVYNENVPMFLQFAVNVMGVPSGFRDPDTAIADAIDRLQTFYKRMGLATTLTEIGIEGDKLETMAKKATFVYYGKPEQPQGSFKTLYWQDVLEIYKLAL